MSVVWILPGATGHSFRVSRISHLWHHPVDGAEGADKERFLRHLVGVDLGVKLQSWKELPARPLRMEHDQGVLANQRAVVQYSLVCQRVGGDDGGPHF